ncbi:hypothetical protein SLEP1_g20337 [Rubroshorea leprosula]|uniref:Uncharacterized protein n=1 Tax=Rubroshorea leprosula TaxID=152421 RepID=A0AAV5JCZ7_9ROSI|nr:hypothetical protein SLEP1_g20337 [Rubroshorea leprosula]
MGKIRFLKSLFVSVLLLLSFSRGFDRKVMETVEYQATTQMQEIGVIPRTMIEVMDYKDPEPNTNTQTGYIFAPPS